MSNQKVTRDPAILFVRPDSVSPESKAALREAGVIVVEMDDPLQAKLVRAHSEIDGSALLKAAATAIYNTGTPVMKAAFAEGICAAIMALAPKEQ